MVSLALAYGLIVVSALILLRAVAVSSRSAVLTFASIVGLSGGLAILSPERPIGDSR